MRRRLSRAGHVNLDYCLVRVPRHTEMPSELIDDILAGGESEAPTLANDGFALERIEAFRV